MSIETKISFPARVDTVYCQEQSDAIVAQVKGSEGTVVFDMVGVNYICSAFLRVCITVLKSLGKENFKIVNCDSEVRKVFQLAGYNAIMKIG